MEIRNGGVVENFSGRWFYFHLTAQVTEPAAKCLSFSDKCGRVIS
jgi:hypothetical protein